MLTTNLNEEYAIVLDFLPTGRAHSFKQEPIAQVIGKNFFTLLEVVPKEGIELKPQEEVYIGKEERDKIERVKGRIIFNELTTAAQDELEIAIEKIVNEREKDFVDFFNNAVAITIKMHQLQLLPGLGRKHLEEILKAREERKFENFEDIEKRVPGMPSPKKLVVKRVIEELQEPQKHYLFVRPPPKERRFRR
ncbi:MAG: DUF655 domain-containing protein [Candidatus Diapherotrites archaeon]|nr:DUF655 domain-containing protein [Candidatus Diapherotrites archaeon]